MVVQFTSAEQSHSASCLPIQNPAECRNRRTFQLQQLLACLLKLMIFHGVIDACISVHVLKRLTNNRGYPLFFVKGTGIGTTVEYI